MQGRQLDQLLRRARCWKRCRSARPGYGMERDRVSEALLPTGPAPRRVELRMRDGQHFGAVLCPVSVGPDAGRGAILACEEAPPAKEYRPPAFWMAALL